MHKCFRIVLSGLLASLVAAIFTWMAASKRLTDTQAVKQNFEHRDKNLSVECPSTVTARQIRLLKNGLMPYMPCQLLVCGSQSWASTRPSKCEKSKQSSMLTLSCPSRLGNQMFSYATLFAIAHVNNRKAYISPSMSYYISKYFNVSLDQVHPDVYQSRRILWRQIIIGGILENRIRNLSNQTDQYIKLIGVPQVWQNFDNLRPLILKEFRFYDFIIESSKAKLVKIKELFFGNTQLNVTLIGVHVRRGDYIKEGISENFKIPGVEFYRGAMSYFSNLFVNVIFIVAGNDADWCEKHFTANNKFDSDLRIHILKGVSEDNGGMDLALLAHCNHIIFGLGTFGWWAGYLTQGKVIYCADCITPNTTWLRHNLVYNGDYGNVVLPGWIGFSLNGTQSLYLAKTISAYYGAGTTD